MTQDTLALNGVASILMRKGYQDRWQQKYFISMGPSKNRVFSLYLRFWFVKSVFLFAVLVPAVFCLWVTYNHCSLVYLACHSVSWKHCNPLTIRATSSATIFVTEGLNKQGLCSHRKIIYRPAFLRHLCKVLPWARPLFEHTVFPRTVTHDLCFRLVDHGCLSTKTWLAQDGN
jgi:hypothetical protein